MPNARFRPLVIVVLTIAAIAVAIILGRLSGVGTEPAGAPEPAPAVVLAGLPSGTTEAVVEYVHDGDTLFLEDGRKVRLLGIDTPEIGDDAECYGDEATSLLRSLLPEGTRVSVLADVQPLDQYGRSLLFVYTDDATNVNLEMLERGAAEAVVLTPNVMFADQLEQAEYDARAAGRGMWGEC